MKTQQNFSGAPILVIAAHPDDETIGMGAQFISLQNSHVLHVTDGAPYNDSYTHRAGKARTEYAEVRREESLRALGTAGISPSQIECLGVVDQESSYQLEGVARTIAAAIKGLKPEIIITHPYEGGHPDHDATAFAVHAARQLIEREHPAATLLEFTSYHLRNGHLQTYDFLGRDGLSRTIYLSTAQQRLKSAMLSCYVSQQGVLAAFAVAIERFRIAPQYDFSKAPHAGALYYDHHDWGITSTQWRRRAIKAMARLGIGGSF
jgi:LmbE family N-acetylglucosaminyl deacetylase